MWQTFAPAGEVNQVKQAEIYQQEGLGFSAGGPNGIIITFNGNSNGKRRSALKTDSNLKLTPGTE